MINSDILNILKEFSQDGSEAIKELKNHLQEIDNGNVEEVNQYKVRNYIRAVFSGFEGYIYIIRNLILQEDLLSEKPKLTEKEINVIKDMKDGKIHFLSLIENIKFTRKIWKKVLNEQLEIPLDCKSIENFKKAVHIRNRVTHPKKIEEFIIHHEERIIVLEAHSWFLKIQLEIEKTFSHYLQ